MKLLLFSRRGVVHAADELRRTFAAIARYGFDFVVNKEFAETIRSLGVAQIPAEKEYGCNACPPVGDGAVMVCYGGDGTLLDGVRLLGGAPVPVVGINAGHMGFLTGGRKEAIEELFAEIARGTLRIEQRTMLRVEGAVEGMPQGALAVNEAAVQRSGAGMISVECRVDDQQVATYYGDGVIVKSADEDLDEVIPSMDSEYKMGYYLTKELLREDKNLTAIVGMNDMIAFGIMDAVLKSKLRIPADISVVGCDNTVYSSFRSISLTTIDHYVPLKGRDACDIILRKIQSLRESQDGNEPLSTYHVEYEPKLIVRRSTSYARTEKLKNK